MKTHMVSKDWLPWWKKEKAIELEVFQVYLEGKKFIVQTEISISYSPHRSVSPCRSSKTDVDQMDLRFAKLISNWYS